MRYPILVIHILLLSAFARAQKGISGLIDAERSFAAYSVAHGTKAAFLRYLDSSGTVFEKGKPVNGIAAWRGRDDLPGVLNWWPTFAGISQSGDFGFTTGPWIFLAPGKDTVVASGRFTTVWHIDEQGEWKFLVDLGVSNCPLVQDTAIRRLQPGQGIPSGSVASLLDAEREFIQTAERSATEAYHKFLGPGIVNRNHQGGLTVEDTARAIREGIRYKVLGSGIAGSGDMGYVYGETVVDNKTDNYLRIWMRRGRQWEIVVEVLRY